MLVRELFKRQVERTAYATAVVFREEAHSWRDLDWLSNRLAQGLFALGLKKGERVAALLPNSVELIIAYLAMLKAGGVFVPLNPQLTAAHLRYALDHSEARFLIHDAELNPVVKEAAGGSGSVQSLITVGGKGLGGAIPWEEVLARGSDVEPSVPIKDEDNALILYTAGTTGDPKGALHTHYNCGFVAQHWAQVFRMGPGKSAMLTLPLFHAFALHCVTLPALVSGARLVMSERYHTQWTVEAIERYRVNVLSLVPAMATLIINHADLGRYDFSSLEITLMGGAIVPFELLRQWRARFPKLEILNAYGQTESCPCCTGLWDVDILEKPRSVGKPWPVVELKIADDEGRSLPPTTLGEIIYRVASMMKGYYKDPELTAQTIRNGWLHSGDLGYVDTDGYVYIVDRKKDIIIRGGENISSMEVEEVIYRHPAVLEASVIGAPDSVLGERVMAVVVKKPGHELSEDGLIEFCRTQLEAFKVPSRVEFIDTLPRNPGGKVLKRELKKRYFA